MTGSLARQLLQFFDGDSWVGELTEINPMKSYVMDICSGDVQVITGSPVPNEVLDLDPGFAWLGYLPQQCMEINTALDSMNPEANNNDRLIGQTNFATYFGNEWVGSLNQLCPGDGFVIDVSHEVSLHFPDVIEKQGSEAGRQP